MAKKQYRSRIAESVHTTVAGMHKAGTMSKETLRHFDESCLASPANLEPAEIKALRESFNLSQPVFARYLNTSESTVAKWERGDKHPSGIALKMLAVVQKHGLEVLK
ncbi:MAG TPA: DNA-binding transcriptional regulator [Drouetiella sp.]